jgi:hypothetical protein
MDGIVLDRAEFLVLLDAVRATAVVGFDSQDLFPNQVDEHRALLSQGVAQLQQRGYLEVRSDGVRAVDETLLQVATVVAQPQIALITVRDNPGVGSQLFLHYQNGPFVVEQTLPEPGKHRLATIPNVLGMFDRLLAIFPLQDQLSVSPIAFRLRQEVFLQVKEFAEQSKSAQAYEILVQHKITPEQAQLLIDALATPRFGGNVAMLRCEKQKIIDGRNPAVVQGPQNAWIFLPDPENGSIISIVQSNAAIFKEQLVKWFKELLPELFST